MSRASHWLDRYGFFLLLFFLGGGDVLFCEHPQLKCRNNHQHDCGHLRKKRNPPKGKAVASLSEKDKLKTSEQKTIAESQPASSRCSRFAHYPIPPRQWRRLWCCTESRGMPPHGRRAARVSLPAENSGGRGDYVSITTLSPPNDSCQYLINGWAVMMPSHVNGSLLELRIVSEGQSHCDKTAVSTDHKF